MAKHLAQKEKKPKKAKAPSAAKEIRIPPLNSAKKSAAHKKETGRGDAFHGAQERCVRLV